MSWIVRKEDIILSLMSKVKVVIIEDEFFAAKHLKSLIEENGFECVSIFRNGEDFVNKTDWNFDLAMVDIFLTTDFSGLQVAEHMNKHKKPFLFLTANQDMLTLQEAARLSPQTYITKPFNPNDVIAALEMIKYQLPEQLEIQDVNGKRSINPMDILYIQADRSYIEIYTSKEKIVQRKSLNEIIEVLPEQFVRVHRSFLINTIYVQSISASKVVIDGIEIPISRSYRGVL